MSAKDLKEIGAPLHIILDASGVRYTVRRTRGAERGMERDRTRAVVSVGLIWTKVM